MTDISPHTVAQWKNMFSFEERCKLARLQATAQKKFQHEPFSPYVDFVPGFQ